MFVCVMLKASEFHVKEGIVSKEQKSSFHGFQMSNS